MTEGSEFMSQKGQEFTLLNFIQTSSGAHPASHPKGTGSYFPTIKRQESEADHSPPTSAEVKKTWVYTSIPPYVFMA
jgi:hypothetical protein